MKCSIVILNWNGEKMLRQFLPSVVRYSKGDDIEVVVADNGSTDRSLEVLQAFPTVRQIILDKNYGFAEGYNKALEQVQSTYSVLLNSDIEVTEGWLTPILRYMDENPDVVAAQPKIRKYILPITGIPQEPDSSLTYPFEHAGAAGGHIDMLGYPFCRGRIMNYVEDDMGQYDTPARIFWATGCALFIRTDIYKKVGGLDADFFAHMEEIDLCWRLNSRGYKLVCIPESVVYHVGGGALAYENPRKTFLNFRNNMLLLYKNLPASRLWWTMMLRCILDYVAGFQYLLTGKVANARAVVDARIEYHKLKPAFKTKRLYNIAHANEAFPSTIAKRSIIFDYYLCKKRQ